MKKKKELSDGLTFEIIFFFVGPALMYILFALAVETDKAQTYIGTAGLLTVRRKILFYLFSRICVVFAPLICLLISGFCVHLYRHEPLRPSKDRLKIGLLCCLVLFIIIPQHRTGFETQCERNGYHGLRIMKMTALLIDVQKDLLETEPPEVQTVYAERRREIEQYRFGNGGRYAHRSGQHTYYEYALQDPDSRTIIAQITRREYEKAEQICKFAAHEIAVYPHSGFLASFEGGEMPQLNDFETLFTLTYSPADGILHRTEHPKEKQMLQLELVTERNGEVIGRFATDKGTEEFYDPNMTNTRIWLEMSYDNARVRVSNIIEI
ncbi:MAG: hypothetical protein IKQ91_06185 [Oscillospiraceae bacterium]|nr:hypothetical protein [Oscillospiraceae bacterium]